MDKALWNIYVILKIVRKRYRDTETILTTAASAAVTKT